MNRGGTETWLMHVLRHVDPQTIQMDFLVNEDREDHFSSELRQLGSRLLTCSPTSNPLEFCRRFRNALFSHEPYDILHAHKQNFSALILMAGQLAGIPVRIAHSHLDTRRPDSQSRLLRKAYLRATRFMISRYATHGIGCSDDACRALFGEAWQDDPRWHIIECGLNFDRFSPNLATPDIRSQLGYSADHFIIGHVGRFDDQKNQTFLLEAFKSLSTQMPRARLMLIGHGPDEKKIQKQIESLGLTNVVRLLTNRSDIPELMINVFDTFAFPSRFEGLGLALVEAQAAGLPCLVSEQIPNAATVIDSLITRLPINQGTGQWVECLLKLSRRPATTRLPDAWQIVTKSRFSVNHSADSLMALYRNAFQGTVAETHLLSSKQVA